MTENLNATEANPEPSTGEPRKRTSRRQTTLVTWEKGLLIVVRLALAYLFFTQLWWKVPPDFGCVDNYSFTEDSNGDDFLSSRQGERTQGLCDWLGIQSFHAEHTPWRVFMANLDNEGEPEIFLDLTFVRQLNGWAVNNIVMPNIQIFGWLIWLAEFSIFALLGLGLFSRLGGLIALGVSLQLAAGLAGITNPSEWEWIYLNMFFISLAVIATAPGRFFGLDHFLIPRLERLETSDNANTSRLAKLGLFFTGR